MPGYLTNPTVAVAIPMLQSGLPAYAFGSKLDGHPTVKMIIDHVSITSNVATITGTIVEGFIPAVGDIAEINGCSNAVFNVSGKTITAVSIVAATGKGTITFALTNVDVPSAAASGILQAVQSDVPEALTGSDQKSLQFAVQALTGRGRGISWEYLCPSAPVSIAIQLEGAINDIESEYAIIGSSQTTAGGAQVFATAPVLVNFVRLHITASTGGTVPTIVGKILQS